MADAGVNQYTFHIEPVNDVESVCRKIKENGMKVINIIIYIFYNKRSTLDYYIVNYIL